MWGDSLRVLTHAGRDAQLPLSGLSACQRCAIRVGLHRGGRGYGDHGLAENVFGARGQWRSRDSQLLRAMWFALVYAR